MNIFQLNKERTPGKSTFNLSHDRQQTLQMGRLVPCLVLDTLPGDVFNIRSASLLRMSPLLAPIMHKINVDIHYFYVPNRICWSNWDKFIAGEDVSHPYITFTPDQIIPPSSLLDYLGYPTGHITRPVSPFPISAYHKIFKEYYEDQNIPLYPESPFVPNPKMDLIDGDNSNNSQNGLTSVGYYSLKPYERAWEHDYFTSALPFSQQSDEVSLDTLGAGLVTYTEGLNGEQLLRNAQTDGILDGPAQRKLRIDTNTGNLQSSLEDGTSEVRTNLDPAGTLEVTTSGGTGTTIRELRRLFRLQEFLEKQARSGSRMTEMLLSFFGVRSPDSRLQRPEYLGSNRQYMATSEVLGTAQTDVAGTEFPIGQLAGHGISAGSTKNINYMCLEHGYILGIMSIMPKTSYYQGLPKHLTRSDRFDYAWPQFAHIGEQEIKNYELKHDHSDGDGTFGYIPRYSEYKYMNSSTHGDFRGNLEYWHLSRKFENDPSLSVEFIYSNPSERIFAVQSDDDKIYANISNMVQVKRVLPKFDNPKL